MGGESITPSHAAVERPWTCAALRPPYRRQSGPTGGRTMSANDHGTVRVQVTSVDGNLSHPFKRSDTLGDVQRYAYDRLVQDKGAVALEATSIELGGAARDLATPL